MDALPVPIVARRAGLRFGLAGADGDAVVERLRPAGDQLCSWSILRRFQNGVHTYIWEENPASN